MASERRNQNILPSGNLHVAQNRDFKIRFQRNQDYSPDQAAEVAETKN